MRNMMKLFRPLVLGAFVLAACSESPVVPEKTLPVVRGDVSVSPNLIVTVAEGNDPAEVAASYGITPTYVYRHALNGFAASAVEAGALVTDTRVERIESDGIATASEQWNLDRLDQRALPLDNSYTPPNDGSGVNAYIIDSGIRSTHSDFTGRVGIGADFTGLGTTEDCLGHGTHVSGIVGGTVYGVAKRVTLYPFRVFPCVGSTPWSTVLAAMDSLAKVAVFPAVTNMSLGGAAIQAIDDAVANLTSRGITVVVAAGNSNYDACFYSPARAPTAITVSATSSNDYRAGFANWGDCVDLFAPGNGVTSDWYLNDNSSTQLSGTSMASPHVAGVAALILSVDPALTPSQVDSVIKATATKGVVLYSNTTRNDLVYSGTDTIPPPPAPKPGNPCPPGWHKQGKC
jgi:subtilisin family serine protease